MACIELSVKNDRLGKTSRHKGGLQAPLYGLAKYCGIVWKENQSGEFQAEDTPMNKAGNRYLRYYMVEAAGSVIQHCPEYKAFYDKKFAEVRTHQHKRALALTSRKLIRMLFGLLANGKLYSVEKSR